MRTLTAITLLLSALPSALVESTPQDTLNKFATAIVAKDFAAVASLVVGGSSDLSGFDAFAKDDFRGFSLSIKVDSLEITGTRAITKITSTFSSPPNDKSDVNETVELALQEDGIWKIVPPKKVEQMSLVGFFAMLAGNPAGVKEMVADAKKAALSTVRLSNMKQLALGVMIMMVDHDDFFPKNPGTLKKQIMPYVKNEELFKDPATKQVLPLFLNPALVGKSQLKVKKPAETPMLAWGKPGSLWFDERGYTYVAFSDGHVKRMDKAGAAKLRWSL